MDKHYLTPLFLPASVAVFAGPEGDPSRQTREARALRQALATAPGTGMLQFLDVTTTGTLGDLARSRADLAIIALPPEEIAAALEVAGRIACRSALVIGSGVDAEQARACTCSGPIRWASSDRSSSSTPVRWGRWRWRGRWRWCRSRAR
jgi:acetyltransferase